MTITITTTTLTCILTVLILTPSITIAHSAHDPIKDISKNNQTITARQLEFEQSKNEAQKIENLRDQIRAMESKIIALRNVMASDYSHIKEKMSKYKLDYMENVDDTLAQLKKTLTQTDALLNQQKLILEGQ